MIEQDISPTDAIAAPPGSTILGEAVYNNLVDLAGSDDNLTTSLGVVLSSLLSLTLDQIKIKQKKIVQKQGEAAFGAKYGSFDICIGIKAGAGKPAYDNMMADAVTYKAAIKTAKDAIISATTTDTVISITFVEPV
jgi:hypothetical protein